MGAFQHSSIILLSTNSEREAAYQEKTLRQIISDTKGILIDANKIPLLREGGLWWNFVRASLPPLIFRLGGDFMIGMPQEDAIDAGINQAKYGAQIKNEFIEKGDLIDDFGDNAWGGIFHQDGVIHQEELALYDHRTQNIGEFFNKINNGYTENHLGLSFSFCLEDSHDEYGPKASNYNKWQAKIKRVFDKDNISDANCYIAPEQNKEE